MKLNRRQAIFGSIAAAFAGPGLVASVEAAELRKAMEPLIEWFNKHNHHVVYAPRYAIPFFTVSSEKFKMGPQKLEPMALPTTKLLEM